MKKCLKKLRASSWLILESLFNYKDVANLKELYSPGYCFTLELPEAVSKFVHEKKFSMIYVKMFYMQI